MELLKLFSKINPEVLTVELEKTPTENVLQAKRSYKL